MNQLPALPRTPSAAEKAPSRTARLVLALPDTPRRGEIRQYFADQGWEVHIARSSCEVRTLAHKLSPAATVLAADGSGGESGWLTCSKLVLERPRLRVVLVGEKPSPRTERLAAFVGAASYLPQSASLQALERAVVGSTALSRN